MKVLSLFDGMVCGMIAMQLAGMEVESYDAYEIDKYAIKAAQHNFPMIKEHGDVFGADFTQYEGVDFLIGGSPCTYWSIAQTKNRETVASGMGWELFSQYVRALHEAKPKYFIYENNKSMSKQIRASIDETFGFEAVPINSALVSAQNRQRLYWVGKRNPDGTYSKVDVEQPEDRGILLRDILETGVCWREKSCTLDANYYKGGNLTSLQKQSGHRLMAAEPLITTPDGKSFCITATEYKGSNPQQTLTKHRRTMVAEPIEPRCVAQRGRYPENPKARVAGLPTEQMFEEREDGKTNTLTTVQKDNLVAEPINVTDGSKSQTLKAQYAKNNVENFCCYTSTYGATGVAEPIEYIDYVPRKNSHIVVNENAIRCAQNKNNASCAESFVEFVDKKSQTLIAGRVNKIIIPAMPVKEATVKGYTEIECGECVDLSMPNSKTRRGRNMKDKSNCMQTSNDFYQYVAYAIEFDDDGRPIKAIGKDGKEITIYEVKDGKITIKGKQYPIKLRYGYYIIRKLTVRECMRLQTVPEWYEFPVSDSQAYKMLGNGWTCEVIAHILKYLKEA